MKGITAASTSDETTNSNALRKVPSRTGIGNRNHVNIVYNECQVCHFSAPGGGWHVGQACYLPLEVEE
jgi:cytochrome c2